MNLTIKQRTEIQPMYNAGFPENAPRGWYWWKKIIAAELSKCDSLQLSDKKSNTHQFNEIK